MNTIKNELLKSISNHIDAQTKKGVEKYKKTLDACPYHAHDWQQMIIEELIDALKYQQKEIQYLYGVCQDRTEKEWIKIEEGDNA